jgi:hypothetical protein
MPDRTIPRSYRMVSENLGSIEVLLMIINARFWRQHVFSGERKGRVCIRQVSLHTSSWCSFTRLG